jgi:hypothetical protein
MTEKLLLVKFHNNWADEFNVNGFAVWSKSKWEKHKADVAKLFENVERGEITVGVGSNQQLTFDNMKDYLDSFHVVGIYDEEYATLKRLFGEEWRKNIEYGMFLSLEDQIPLSDEEMDEDE